MLIGVATAGTVAVLCAPGVWVDRRKRIVSALVGGVAFALLTAPHWLIFLDTLRLSMTSYDKPVRGSCWPRARTWALSDAARAGPGAPWPERSPADPVDCRCCIPLALAAPSAGVRLRPGGVRPRGRRVRCCAFRLAPSDPVSRQHRAHRRRLHYRVCSAAACRRVMGSIGPDRVRLRPQDVGQRGDCPRRCVASQASRLAHEARRLRTLRGGSDSRASGPRSVAPPGRPCGSTGPSAAGGCDRDCGSAPASSGASSQLPASAP